MSSEKHSSEVKSIYSFFSFKYFIFWIIVTFGIYYFFFMNNSVEVVNKETFETVELWNIKKSISVPWTAQLVDEQSLKFTQTWKVVKVNFKEWDKIKKWQIIAELDKTDWLYKVDDANIALDSAKLKLEQLYDVDDIKILNAEKTIESTKNNILNANKELELLLVDNQNSLDNLKKNIDISKVEYDNSTKSLENDKKNLEVYKKQQVDSLNSTNTNLLGDISNIEDSVTSNLLNAEKNLDWVDVILWITDKNKNLNDSYETYLSAKNSSYLNDAKASFWKANSIYISLKNDVSNYTKWDVAGLKNILNKMSWLYSELYNTSDFTYKAIDNSVENVHFTQSDIDSKKSSISTYRSSALSTITSINSNIDNLNTLTNVDLIVMSNEVTIKQKEDAITTSELALEKKKNDQINQINNYESTKNNYDLNVLSKNQSITLLEKTLEINNKDLEKLNEWPTVEDIKLAQNSIRQAEIKVENALDVLTNYELEAPFDWIVRKIDFQVWDNIDSNSEKFVYIENPNLLEIIIMLDQIDIVKVKVWDKALVKFDSYSDKQVEWQISLVDTTPVTESWVVSFQVKIIVVEEGFDKKILSWMTADIEIITEEKNDVIIVSTTAIKELNWKKYVTVDNGQGRKDVDVITGIESWWKTEILTWLNVWDKIVISDFTASSTTDNSAKKWSIIPLPTWRGGGWWGWWTTWWDSWPTWWDWWSRNFWG